MLMSGAESFTTEGVFFHQNWFAMGPKLWGFVVCLLVNFDFSCLIFFHWNGISLRPDCKSLGSGVPSLMAADKPYPQLQHSLLCADQNCYILKLSVSMHQLFNIKFQHDTYAFLAALLQFFSLISDGLGSVIDGICNEKKYDMYLTV